MNTPMIVLNIFKWVKRSDVLFDSLNTNSKYFGMNVNMTEDE
jgi:hypothetical protein